MGSYSTWGDWFVNLPVREGRGGGGGGWKGKIIDKFGIDEAAQRKLDYLGPGSGCTHAHKFAYLFPHQGWMAAGAAYMPTKESRANIKKTYLLPH